MRQHPQQSMEVFYETPLNRHTGPTKPFSYRSNTSNHVSFAAYSPIAYLSHSTLQPFPSHFPHFVLPTLPDVATSRIHVIASLHSHTLPKRFPTLKALPTTLQFRWSPLLCLYLILTHSRPPSTVSRLPLSKNRHVNCALGTPRPSTKKCSCESFNLSHKVYLYSLFCIVSAYFFSLETSNLRCIVSIEGLHPIVAHIKITIK